MVTVSMIGLTLGWGLQAQAGDLKITLPRRSPMTPVQRLNRDGVEAIRHHHYDKSEAFFYKAYLLDPDDPFTLNNLGYVAELQGEVDRAHNFYDLAAKQPTDAVIDLASSKPIQGKSIHEVVATPRGPLEINHDNVEAVRLLSQGRASEADLLLQKTLKADSQNVFTLNNMGVAKEMEGESQEALKFYDAAAASHSDAAAVVSLNRSWRGKQATAMAARNARKLRGKLASQPSDEVKLAELNLRGVSAINRNDLKAAEQDFREAYALDPNNAFAVNNIGYLAEIQGDRETAQVFYDRAQQVAGANTTVWLATRHGAQGMKLFQVASQSDSKVEARVLEERDAHRAEHQPIVLRRRDNTVVEEPSDPTSGTPQSQRPPMQ
jgi:Flp pilus assembly protein TadD